MDLVKPSPLFLDGRAYYTLTSYGPVSVEVKLLHTTAEDVDLALEATIMQMGGQPGDVNDTWVRSTFAGLHGIDELRSLIEQQITESDRQMVEEQKADLCIEELAKRLVQAVPQRDIDATREDLIGALSLELSEQNLTLDQFRIQSGMRKSEMMAMFNEQARQTAERQAALDAFVDHRHLDITDEELASFLAATTNIEERDAKDILREIKLSGQYGEARDFALRNVAMGIIMEEAHYTYYDETEEEAQIRRQQMRDELNLSYVEPPKNEYPHLKLV